MYILRGSGRFLMSVATGRRKYQMFVQTYNPFAVYSSVVRTARCCTTRRAKQYSQTENVGFDSKRLRFY